MRRVFLLMVAGGLLAIVVWSSLFLWQPEPPVPAEPPRLPSETGWIQRTYPHFKADANAYRRAFAEREVLHRTASKSDIFGSWQVLGPTNIGGRVVDVAFDPHHPDTVYAAAATGGVFKSVDSGMTWAPIFDDQPLLTIGDIAVDPVDTDVIYVGTGEANGGHNNFAGSGVYKSTDGGETWQFLGLDHTVSIGRILVHPTNPQRVYLAAIGSYFGANEGSDDEERGLYRSDDGGARWDKVLHVNDTTGVIDLVMRPDNPNVLFAATWERIREVTGANLSGPNSGIYKSTNGGDSWTKLGPSTGLPEGPSGRIGLSISRDNPDVMYALYTDGLNYQGLYRSDNGGVTWRNANPSGTLSQGFGGFSWYFGQVRAHPTNPDIVFVMDVGLMRSTNGGATWTRLPGTHVDHHALAFHPEDPTFLINGNDGGLALSQNSGNTWSSVASLPVTQFYEIGLDPNDPDRVYGGTQDNGTLRSNGLGGWQRIYGGDGFYVIVHPDDPNIVYAESQNGGLVKIVHDETRNATSGVPPTSQEPRNWSMPVVMDPGNPEVLYLGTNRLYRTVNGAAFWQPISEVLTDQPTLPLLGTITTIAVAPTNSDVIYVGTDDGNVWVSDNYGSTWRSIHDGLPQRWVTRIVIDPEDDQTAYATFSGLRWKEPQPHVFRTQDRGTTWQDISSNLPDAPVNAFAIDPINPNYLYLGSDVGAFVSENGGGSWSPLGTGLPAVSVYDLKIYDDGTQRFLMAGTHGRSMYRLDLAEVPSSMPVASEENPALPHDFTLEAAYPNPFSTQTTLTYHLATPADVQIEVFDVRGRHVATLTKGFSEAGSHTTEWHADAVASGTYLARLTLTTVTGTTTRATMLTRVR
ncbi:MAG TPA: T9SS type A sorting domain-containing protein [Rhodothermales bacterium]|nr:T9SS type A sorting domain-containing protein [Rhodothermales bacterium]